MKRLFTLAAGALIGLSASLPADAAAVEVRDGSYKAGSAITDASQLTTGKYFIYAYSKGAGRFIHPSGDFISAKGLTEIPEAGTTDASYIYTITVNEGGTFNITTGTGLTFPINGDGGQGSGNIRRAQATAADAVVAEFTLADIEVTGQGEFADPLFFVTPTNASHQKTDGTTEPAYLCTNGDAASGSVGYWSGTGSVSEAHYAALAFYPAIDTAADHYYLIKNTRAKNYVQSHTNQGAALSLITSEVLNATEGRYDEGSLWYFVADHQATAVNGYTAVNICNPLKPGQTLSDAATNTWRTEKTTWYISDTQSTSGGQSGFTISKQATASADGWNDFQGKGTSVNYWTNNDAGSKWLFEMAEDTKIAATLEKIDAVLDTEAQPKFEALKAQGNLIAAMAGMPAERKDAWETATSSLASYSKQNFTSLKAAYGTLVDGLHMMFNTLNNTADWMCQKDGGPWCYGPEGNGSRIFTLKNAENEGFYLFNEYTQKYLVHPTGADVNATFNADVNHASAYNIDMRSANETDHAQSNYGIFTISAGVPSDRTYLNTNSNHGIYRWSHDGNGSSWRVTFATEDQAATEDLEGAKNPIVTGHVIGTNLGQYHYTDAFETARENANSATTAEEKRAAATILRNTTPHAINQPVAGHFYRFHYGNAYLSSTTYHKADKDDRFAMVTDANAGSLSTTVFYYDGNHLVTYPEGLVMGNLDTAAGSKENGSFRGVIKGSGYEGNSVTFVESPEEVGKYNIRASHGTAPDRYLFHDANNIDSGTGNVDPNGRNGYRWEIADVQWLPIPVDVTKKHFSVCVPVDLNITADRAEAHTGVIQGTNFGLQSIEGTLPANTPAVLEYKGGADNGCVYFEITYSEISAAAEATNDLTNTGIYAAAKEEGQSYFTVDGENFVPYTGDTLPAFAAVLKVPTEQANETGYAITEYDPDYVSITEIEGAANNGKQVIYDLQGRRVQRASKGLYIINGVKTLVK